MYKELNDWAGRGIRIQEHDRCVSDIIEIDYKEEFISSEHPLIHIADDNNGTKSREKPRRGQRIHQFDEAYWESIEDIS
jgi:hypothetical protein